jgi:hypothetical protein
MGRSPSKPRGLARKPRRLRQLPTGSPAAWRFAPAQLRLDAGGTVQAHNRGGEDHTFTEVANFGGGCIQALNDLLGLTPVPECAGFPGGAFAATLVPAGVSRLTEVGPCLIEVGPIRSSVSLKLARRGVAALALSH